MRKTIMALLCAIVAAPQLHVGAQAQAQGFEQILNRPRRFVDRTNQVRMEVFLTGHHPGRKGPGPVTFPDPSEVAELRDDIRVVNLPQLIQLKLAAKSYYDSADVVSLIRIRNLDESFQSKLHPAVQRDFIECLEEKRGDDEFEAR